MLHETLAPKSRQELLLSSSKVAAERATQIFRCGTDRADECERGPAQALCLDAATPELRSLCSASSLQAQQVLQTSCTLQHSQHAGGIS